MMMQHPSSSAAATPTSTSLVSTALPGEGTALMVAPAAGGGSMLTKSHELVLKRIRDVPALPEVVNQIILLLGQPNASASEIAKLISYDPGLTSRVLRMVNSAAYGFQRQVSSIQHGIMILGFNTVRGLVLSASIFKLLKGDARAVGFDAKAFWAHSLLTAMLANRICDLYELKQRDEAFSAGMLHDVGKLVLSQYFGKEYTPLLAAAARQTLALHGSNYLGLERQMLGLTHVDIGLSLASKWKLPTTLSETIAHHHHPEKAEHFPDLVYTVALANELAVQLQTDRTITVAGLSTDIREFFSIEADSDLEFLSNQVDTILEQLAEVLKTFQQQ